MADPNVPASSQIPFDRISLRRLVLIRWVAVTGQVLTLVTVHYGLAFRLPLVPAFAIVGCSVLFNLVFVVSRRAATRLGEREATLFLGYDTLQLAGLLYLTGGLENPFAILMLAPVTVGATILSRRPVIGLAGFAIAAITALALWHLPLPWRASPEPLDFPPQLIVGHWTALVFATVFIASYTWSVAREARRLRDAVAATQLALAREQRVSAVGALAAAAAHELGSPLATIAVVAGELVRDLPADSPHAEDAALLLSQSERCRRILAELAHQPQEDGGSPYARLPISALVEAAGALYHDPRVRLIFAATGVPEHAEPLVQRSPEIMHGLHNLIQNAVQFARREVSVATFWDSEAVTVEIADDGPGIPANLLGRLGEPYLSTRADSEGHMGLGIFIAQSLLERSGAQLSFENLEEGGAHVAISWKRDNLEAVARHPATLAAAPGNSERQTA
ncbi:MAG TPA: ActS/PrrB/RegB family redox-sensitive histidine kinase [Stellaceae bacterium]|nr:ActS/PrrB/RegB family redox-sensitive histidine kinase [Stellaceae bacterium]